jgi:hypothetical protein
MEGNEKYTRILVGEIFCEQVRRVEGGKLWWWKADTVGWE